MNHFFANIESNMFFTIIFLICVLSSNCLEERNCYKVKVWQKRCNVVKSTDCKPWWSLDQMYRSPVCRTRLFKNVICEYHVCKVKKPFDFPGLCQYFSFL